MDQSSPFAVFALLGAGFFIFIAGISIFSIICHWMVYKKAGQPGWACIVPIYGAIVFLKIIGKPLTWLLFLLIPFVNFVYIFIWWIKGSILLAKSFGKDTGFAVGLMFLPMIFYAILAFDRTIQYVGPAGDPTQQSFRDQVESIGNPAV
jgi:hypothetical protein